MTISKEKQEGLQQKYLELQMLGQQMQSLQKQLQLSEQQILELAVAKQAIDEVSQTKQGTEILVPVISGIFVKGQLKDSKDFIVNIGSNTAVTKSAADSKNLLEEQETGIRKAQVQLNAELQRLGQRAVLLEKELAELSK